MLGSTADKLAPALSHSVTEIARMKTFPRLLLLGSLFLVCGPVFAQGGCVNSPECPTAILGLVGAAGAALYARLKSR